MDVASRELDSFQLRKLDTVLREPIEIHPLNNFPALSIAPATLVKVVKDRLVKKEIKVKDIRMNGSAASHCLCKDHEIHFNDIDLIFGVSIERESDFHVIKEEVLTALLEFFPKGVTTENISCLSLEETYVKKMVLVSNSLSKWSLISLGDQRTNNTSIELKFVSKIKRAFEFTVDSFQIQLDSYLMNQQEKDIDENNSCHQPVRAISMYRDIDEALHHLNNRLIHTEAPEEIRGGGLLKYCSLLVSGFQPADGETMLRLEPYMCSRFFIDFPTNEAQYFKIHKYIMRFLQHGDFGKCIEFLGYLERVVMTQAMCLMEPERQKTIFVIAQLRAMVLPPFGYHYLPPPPHHPLTGIPNPHLSFRSLVPSHPYHYDPMRTSPPPPLHPHSWNSHPRPATTTKVR